MSKQAPPQPPPQQPPLNDIISTTSHQVLLFSSQGTTNDRVSVGQNIKNVPYTTQERNGQTKKSVAYYDNSGTLSYDFLSINAQQGYDLYGTIIECDIDYTFYNSVYGYNNQLYVSLGPLDENNAPTNPLYVGTVFIDTGVFTPDEYAETVKNALNGFYEIATQSPQTPFEVEYLQTKRRFKISMGTTTEQLDFGIYDKFPVQQGAGYPQSNNEEFTAFKHLGLVRNTGQTVPNYYKGSEKLYGNIGYWIVPHEGHIVSPACVDLRLTDAIQISSVFDSQSRNSNRNEAEDTNIITSVAVPAILRANEPIPSTLSFKPNDFMYKSTFRINKTSLSKLSFVLTDLRGGIVNMNGGSYTIRIMIYNLPSIDYALMDSRLNTMEQYMASIPQFSKKTAGGERIAEVVPPKGWLERLKKITLAELKHKYLE